jgi:DNA replication protein DnaC
MLYTSLADESADEMVTGLSRFDLLIIDNVSSVRTKPEYPSLLLDLISVCQNDMAFIATPSISFEDWETALGDPIVTHAIIDRLMHNAHIINIRNGLSYRMEGPNTTNTNSPQSISQ